MADDKQYKTADKFDRVLGELKGLADVITTKPSTKMTMLPMLGAAQTHIVQTFRQAEVGDFIFLQYLDGDGFVRLVIPPKVANLIASQREALTKKSRRHAAKQRAKRDKDAGVVPGFLRKGKKKAKKKGAKQGASRPGDDKLAAAAGAPAAAQETGDVPPAP